MASSHLKTALTHAGLTAEELADRLQVDPRTVRRWLDGRTPYPRHRASISGLLNRPVLELWPELAANSNRNDNGQSEPVAETVTVLQAGASDDSGADWRALTQTAQRRVDLLDLTLADVITNDRDAELLAAAAGRGCHVRVLVSDRDSVYLAIAEQELGHATRITSRPSLTSDLDQVVELLRPQAAERAIELRAFVGAGAYRVLIIDDHALVTLRVAGVAAAETPVLDVARGDRPGSLYDTFSRHFETVWRTADTVQ